jgi:uncharacterized protein (DUF433 family)
MSRDEQLIARYIEPNPHKPWPDEAWVGNSAVPVWILVAYLRAVGGDVEQLADAYYTLPREAIRAALAYYRDHRDLIDARIARNAA